MLPTHYHGVLMQLLFLLAPLPVAAAFRILHRKGGIPTSKCSQYLCIRDITKEGEEELLC